MANALLKAEHISVTLGGRYIVRDASLAVEENMWLAVVGPNGAGKSTLVKALTGAAAHTGAVEICGQNAAVLRPRQLAQKIGVLAQNHHITYGFTVEEAVSLGRYCRQDENDAAMVDAALHATGMEALRRQSLLTLSGGELQRAFLAQALAQDPAVLVLDEAENHLDLAFQKQLFTLVGKWVTAPGRAVVSVVHDVSVAKKFGTHAALMDGGRLLAVGETTDVLTNEHLDEVYGMDVAAWMRGMLEPWV